MALTALAVLASATHPIGVTTWGPVAVPIGATRITVALDRTRLALATKEIFWSQELSTDGGATWLPWGGAGTLGGVLLDHLGQPILESFFQVPLPAPADARTLVRGALSTAEVVMTAITMRAI